jgi:integrase
LAASAKFHLTRPQPKTPANEQEPTAIFLLLYGDGKQIKLPTGESIHPAEWDSAEQRAKVGGRGRLKMSDGNALINATLARIGAAAVACYDRGKAAGQLPTRDELRAAIKAEDPNAKTIERPQPLPDFAARLTRMMGLYAANTIKSHNTTYQHLMRYANLSRRPLEYTHFTREWAEKFAAWLSAGAGVREHMADGSVNKQLKLFKEFLADAADRGRTPRIDVKGWSWKFVEPEVMALTAAEVGRIETLEGLPPYLENARCLWLLMAYTGLRYSDAMKLKPEHDKGEVLQLVPKKTTDISATVYIRKAARALLNKCWAGELHEISNTKLNDYIKLVCQRAGIDELVEKITYYGQTSRPKKEVFKKYELVTCHTARRTQITLSFAKEIPLELIMMSAGHTNSKTTLRYNQNTVARQVEVSRRAWGEE